MRHHKQVERLMLFAQVAETLSFTRAAKALGVSRAHLSEQVRRLEQDIGAPLLIRTTRAVRLTEEGERIRQRMQSVHGELLALERELEHDLEQTSESERQGYSGVLRITAPVLFAERYLVEVCNAFQGRHPAVELRLDVSYESHDLTREPFDVAFRATRTPPDNMIARRLLDYVHCCCASPEYLAAHGTPHTAAALGDHRCHVWSGQSGWPLASGEVSLAGGLAINDHRLLKQQALGHTGIIRVAHYLVDRELAEGRLVRLLAHEEGEPNSIYMLYPQRLPQSGKLRAFMAAVEAAMPPRGA
ncbi:LysR family transcriptional regulator [Cobetia sp. 1AS1]|uniref:LysR family transcriptional regulator n=1 Tax=Cobetia sp. 1AS1 TaxID=3040016 RepID=UPI002449AD04|nr:LysR family transcriptional regulator [Cobetia sp. 1AS1]MDH2293337.1 LysR family transcriptional regulator [Cobetia sp. 1AS1]